MHCPYEMSCDLLLVTQTSICTKLLFITSLLMPDPLMWMGRMLENFPQMHEISITYYHTKLKHFNKRILILHQSTGFNTGRRPIPENKLNNYSGKTRNTRKGEPFYLGTANKMTKMNTWERVSTTIAHTNQLNSRWKARCSDI